MSCSCNSYNLGEFRFGGSVMQHSVEIKHSGPERSELVRLARGRKIWRALSDRAHIVLLAAEELAKSDWM